MKSEYVNKLIKKAGVLPVAPNAEKQKLTAKSDATKQLKLPSL